MLFFTVCHIQQLAEAFVLGDSLKKQSNDNEFVIGLVDDKSWIPVGINLPYQIVEVSEIGILNFKGMCKKYTCEELLADSKPFFAEYFLQRFPKQKKMIYLDATSLVFNKFDFIEKKLLENSIILVPQIINANRHIDEKQILNTGIFHAGFCAINRSDETLKFLKWWQEKVAEKGFIDVCKGLNADQLWLELVPALFDKVWIEKHEGLNVGFWNLSERKVQYIDNQVFSNKSLLISYNFKGSKYWKSYLQQLQKYPKSLQKIKPAYGIFVRHRNPNFVSKTLRGMAKFVDVIIDKIS